MKEANEGDTVQVHYKGTLEDGTVFDSSAERDPLQFTIGSGQVIPGFEQAIVGMKEGEKKIEKIPADDAYGVRRDELLLEVEREAMPTDQEIKEGDWLHLVFQDGRTAPVKVVSVDEEKVKLDANHPLAGKDLTFELQLV